MALTAGPANGATPPWESGNSNAVGTIAFYDASGKAVTSGSTSSTSFAAYAVASGDVRTGDTQADLLLATPSSADPSTWNVQEISGFSTYPLTGAPAALPSGPAVDLTAAEDVSLDTLAAASKDDSVSGYSGVFQVRLKTADSTGLQGAKYATADISIDSSTHTWTEVYPTGTVTPPPVQTPDASALSAGGKTVTKGKSVKITTKLTDTKTKKGFGAKVQLLSKVAGKFKLVKTVTAGAAGNASTTVKPAKTTVYEWHFGGNAAHKAATSKAFTVTVKPAPKKKK